MPTFMFLTFKMQSARSIDFGLPLILAACIQTLPVAASAVDFGDKTFALSFFDSVRMDLPGDALIKKSENFFVQVVAEKSIIEKFSAKVSNSVVQIGAAKNFKTSHPIRITVGLPKLRSIDLAGSANVVASAPMHFDSSSIVLSSAGDIKLTDVSVRHMVVRMSGSGSILAAGNAEHVKINITGSGDIDFLSLKSKKLDFDVDGSGDLKLNVSELMNANVSGVATVVLRGRATVKENVSGVLSFDRDY